MSTVNNLNGVVEPDRAKPPHPTNSFSRVRVPLLVLPNGFVPQNAPPDRIRVQTRSSVSRRSFCQMASFRKAARPTNSFVRIRVPTRSSAARCSFVPNGFVSQNARVDRIRSSEQASIRVHPRGPRWFLPNGFVSQSRPTKFLLPHRRPSAFIRGPRWFVPNGFVSQKRPARPIPSSASVSIRVHRRPRSFRPNGFVSQNARVDRIRSSAPISLRVHPRPKPLAHIALCLQKIVR
jgi:hypothetical protein